jgi:hypothetical protein
MYNPLTILTTDLLKAIIKSPKLFVREYYARGQSNCLQQPSTPFLFTWYDKADEVEQSRAIFHLQQISKLNKPFLYDSENNNHLQKLLAAASQPTGYTIFTNLLPHAWVPPPFLKTNIHNYMLQNLSWWNYNKSHQLHIYLKDKYGQLYIQLSWKNNKAEVLLQDIENCTVCATT